jgi:hypothetical protein
VNAYSSLAFCSARLEHHCRARRLPRPLAVDKVTSTKPNQSPALVLAQAHSNPGTCPETTNPPDRTLSGSRFTLR